MKKIVLLFIVAFAFMHGYSQKIDPELLNDLKARNIGPGGMSGRVTAIAVEPGNDEVIYIGTASGGIWKSDNGGINFEAIFEKEEVAGIGALAIDPSNPDVIWAGTGEGNPRNSITGGYGLYKSLDAGRSWTLVGLEKTRHIHRIIVHPEDGNTVYIGAIGSPWGAHKERGVYKTKDGGKSWKQILFTNELTGVADMVMDPRNPEKLYVAMWEHLRHPWHFTSGGKGSALHITVDGGENWKKITEDEGLPIGELGRIGLAVSRSNPKYVYAYVEAKENAIYRSVDGGYTWSKRGTENIGNRPFYYAEIYVDPANENRLYTLYSNVNISEDGGKTFSTLVSRNIHSDHHAWWIHPENPGFMIDGNDGGMAITHDMGKNWRHITNLPVSQFYHIAVDNDLPYNVYGGMQDNGSWKGPGYVWSWNGIINEYWDFLIGGDGFDVQAVPGDSRYCYAMSQQGHMQRIDTETGEGIGIQPAEGDVKLRWHWNSALSLDPFNDDGLYFGSQFVHKSADRGNSWEVISPDLTTNDTTRQTYNKSGGLTYDVTGAETYTCILAIAPSAIEKDVIWVGTDDGNIQLTQDGGKNWKKVSTKIKEMPDRGWVPQITPSTYNAAEAYVVVNNYRQNDYAPYLFHTKDYGKSWTRMLGEEDVPGYVLSFIQDPVEPKLMFLGTEFGMYVSIDGGEDWVKWENGYPTVSTMDMTIQEREADLVIGTFGRSAYVIDDIRPLRAWAAQGKAFEDKSIQVFDAPDAYMVNSKNAPGYYFHGDAYFMGENKRLGAMVSFYVKEGRTEKQAEPSKDSLFVQFVDSEGVVQRSLKFIPSKGINRLTWTFDRDGFNLDFGGRRGRNNNYPGGGGTVLPGEYTVKMKYQNDSSEAKLVLRPDPRTDYDRTAHIKYLEELDRVKAELTDFNSKVKELNKCEERLGIIEKLAKENKKDSISSTIKGLKKKFSYFDKQLNGDQSVKGIYNDDENFSNRISTLRYMSYNNPPFTPNDLVKVEKALGYLNKMEKEVSSFLEEDWNSFKELVEKEEIQLF